MTTEPIDLYAVLGLARDATQAQIAAAYRTLLRRYHPDTRTRSDTSPDATSDAALQRVLTAYAVLGDPARRVDYDERTRPPAARPRRPAHPIQTPRSGSFNDSPIRAGPVHWTPWPMATNRHTNR